mmetsp:Transcript_35528/g.88368  ORF Transcript_35528/g.88368 Transcript_35528/m.88368 type:complete len:219 (+) Transcript_35528:413-1069(+)
MQLQLTAGNFTSCEAARLLRQVRLARQCPPRGSQLPALGFPILIPSALPLGPTRPRLRPRAVSSRTLPARPRHRRSASSSPGDGRASRRHATQSLSESASLGVPGPCPAPCPCPCRDGASDGVRGILLLYGRPFDRRRRLRRAAESAVSDRSASPLPQPLPYRPHRPAPASLRPSKSSGCLFGDWESDWTGVEAERQGAVPARCEPLCLDFATVPAPP